MRLWVRIAAVMAVVSLAPLVLLGTRAIHIATGEAARSSEAILLRDADATATLVDTWIEDQAQALAGWMQLFPLEAQGEAQQESLQKSVFLAVPSLITVVLLDGDGVPIARPLFLTGPGAPGTTLEGRREGSEQRASELIERVPLSEALASRGTISTAALGTPYVPPGGGAPSVPLAVTGPFGEALVLGAEVGLELLERVIRERSTPDHAVALITVAGADILGGDHPLVDPERLRPVLASRATVAYALVDGREVRGAVAPIPSTGWSVVVVEPVEVAERAARLIRERTTLALALAALLALLSGVIVAANLSRPVRRLRDVAMEVAEGRYGRTADEGRSDEIGELARAFNHMSSRLAANEADLHAQRDEIAAFNRELQARVDARTAELHEAQQELVRSGQLAAVAEVGAGLAHELNNPLAAVLGLTQMLRERRAGTEDAVTLAKIEAQAERCRVVVASMLRLSAGEVDPTQATVVDLRDILRDVLGLVEGPFRQRGVVVDWNEPGDPMNLRIHPVYGTRILAQIFNAFRAGLEEGSRLRVTAVRLGDDVALDLDPERRVAMGSARDDWMASGMALWVARHLLDQVGGRLEQPLAEQTRWRILLPGAP